MSEQRDDLRVMFAGMVEQLRAVLSAMDDRSPHPELDQSLDQSVVLLEYAGDMMEVIHKMLARIHVAVDWLHEPKDAHSLAVGWQVDRALMRLEFGRDSAEITEHLIASSKWDLDQAVRSMARRRDR